MLEEIKKNGTNGNGGNGAAAEKAAPVVETEENPKSKAKEEKAEKKAKDRKIKRVKDQLKGTARAETADDLVCAVCGLPILKGQAYKMIPADEKNGRRHYHQSTCSPGSPNWATFRKGKSHIKETEKMKKKTQRAAKRAERKMNGYAEGTQIHLVHSCLKKGAKFESMLEALKKGFPKATGNLKNNLRWYLGRIKRDGHKVKRTGDKYFLA
jgi:hypothetical protein